MSKRGFESRAASLTYELLIGDFGVIRVIRIKIPMLRFIGELHGLLI